MNARIRCAAVASALAVFSLVHGVREARADLIYEIGGCFTSGAPTDTTNQVFLVSGGSVTVPTQPHDFNGLCIDNLLIDLSLFAIGNRSVTVQSNTDLPTKFNLFSDSETPLAGATFTLGQGKVVTYDPNAYTGEIAVDVSLGATDFFDNGPTPDDLTPFTAGGIFTLDFSNVIFDPSGDGRLLIADPTKPVTVDWRLDAVPAPASLVLLLSGGVSAAAWQLCRSLRQRLKIL